MYTQYTTHYKSVFFIQPHATSSSAEAWHHALGNVYGWLLDSIPRRVKGKQGDFFSRQDFAKSSPDGKPWENQGISIRTQVLGEESPSQFWACRYEHIDKSQVGRRWRTDIGIECMPDQSLRIGIHVAHSLSTDYIGSSVAPAPTVPRVVKYLLKGADWDVKLGSLSLSPTPRIYGMGEVKHLWDILKDEQRGGPVVLVTANHLGIYPLELNKLSEQLIGIAEVCGLPYDTWEEQSYVFPPDFQCFPNSVRVYRKGLAAHQARGRHPFFSASKLQENAPEISRWIVESLVRQAAVVQPQAIFSIDDIENRQRTGRLEQLRQQLETLRSEDNQNKEYTTQYYALLDEQNTALLEEVGTLKQQIKDANEQIKSSQKHLEEANEKIDQLEYDFESSYNATEITRLHKDVKALNDSLSAALSLSTLPKTLRAAAEMAGAIWASRIVFTPDGLTSTERAKCKEAGLLWTGLFHMATTLWSLYFEREGLSLDTIQLEFKASAVTWELSHHETSSTRKNASLMALRAGHFDGVDLNLTPHIKHKNSGPNLLRIYFHRDAENRRIIIGHCGDHLPTAGTRKQ